jgi:hypothetical protein
VLHYSHLSFMLPKCIWFWHVINGTKWLCDFHMSLIVTKLLRDSHVALVLSKGYMIIKCHKSWPKCYMILTCQYYGSPCRAPPRWSSCQGSTSSEGPPSLRSGTLTCAQLHIGSLRSRSSICKLHNHSVPDPLYESYTTCSMSLRSGSCKAVTPF